MINLGNNDLGYCPSPSFACMKRSIDYLLDVIGPQFSLDLTPNERAERDAYAVLTTEECGRALRFRRPEDRARFVRTRAPGARRARVQARGRPPSGGDRRGLRRQARGRRRAQPAALQRLPLRHAHAASRSAGRSRSASTSNGSATSTGARSRAAHFAPEELARIAVANRHAPRGVLRLLGRQGGLPQGCRRRTQSPDRRLRRPARGRADLPVHDDDAFRRGADDARWYLRRLEVGSLVMPRRSRSPAEAVAVTVHEVDALVGLGLIRLLRRRLTRPTRYR